MRISSICRLHKIHLEMQFHFWLVDVQDFVLQLRPILTKYSAMLVSIEMTKKQVIGQ